MKKIDGDSGTITNKKNPLQQSLPDKIDTLFKNSKGTVEPKEFKMSL